MLNKNELRQEIRLQKLSRSLYQNARESEDITQKLLAHPMVKSSRCILLYHPLNDEVDTKPLINILAEQGKTILLPKVTGEESMELRTFRTCKDMKEGGFHIMEPTGPIFNNYPEIDLALIPGMSFDSQGNRLGRGKGYYDRFLKHLPHTYKIGICFEFQKREHIPTTDQDVKMDEII